MAGRFDTTVVIDRPIEEVFAFLADGENDPKFSPRVLEISKTTDGPPGVGTVYASTVKDAGVKTWKCAATASRVGAQACASAPPGCSNTSGSPWPYSPYQVRTSPSST